MLKSAMRAAPPEIAAGMTMRRGCGGIMHTSCCSGSTWITVVFSSCTSGRIVNMMFAPTSMMTLVVPSGSAMGAGRGGGVGSRSHARCRRAASEEVSASALRRSDGAMSSTASSVVVLRTGFRRRSSRTSCAHPCFPISHRATSSVENPAFPLAPSDPVDPVLPSLCSPSACIPSDTRKRLSLLASNIPSAESPGYPSTTSTTTV
mmetsp:Transcript_4419/g.10133  ORF Transcript_4419/g.10133 Transcript_4419/m.10133 type:complete len:205 (+) Transcript_4419:407-1021(+)